MSKTESTTKTSTITDELARGAGTKAIDSVPKWAWGVIGSLLGLSLAIGITAKFIGFDAGRIGEKVVENDVEIKKVRTAADATNEQSALGTIQSLVTELVRQNGELIQGSSETLKAAKETRDIANEIIPRVAKLEADYSLLVSLPARVAELERRVGVTTSQVQAVQRQLAATPAPRPAAK